MLNTKSSDSNSDLPSYKITPRKITNIPNFDDVVADTPDAAEEIEEEPDFE